ncbi:hypothetical protein BRPE64_ACDS15140 [Caballeronia insecticola]|uniref:Uncharacterized protein n=1 Tax=Caballeronia insecticola TaxID=758793 RepID=R4WGZ5_9BURK|nr:hypothetical protein BRPE64_ACDS15140 [Caballeronia insecticola]
MLWAGGPRGDARDDHTKRSTSHARAGICTRMRVHPCTRCTLSDRATSCA